MKNCHEVINGYCLQGLELAVFAKIDPPFSHLSTVSGGEFS